MKVFEVHDLVQGIGRDEKCFPDFEFGARNQEILEAIDKSSNLDILTAVVLTSIT